MENKNRFAFFTVMIMMCFASLMLIVSCGRNKQGAITKERNVPDSALTDSVPQSGDYQFQQDQVPEGLPNQLDSVPDSTNRKGH